MTLHRLFPSLAGAFAISAVALAGCHQMKAGVAAMAGRGGTIEKFNDMPTLVTRATELAKTADVPAWQAPFSGDAADFALFISPDRLLVGTVEVDAYLGVPAHSRVVLYNTRDGSEIWSATRPPMSAGVYRILTLSPVLLMLGSDYRAAVVTALDANVGSPLWQREFSPSASFVTTAGGAQLLIAARMDGKPKLELLDVRNGKSLWLQDLKDIVADSTRPTVLVDGDALFVVDQKAASVSVASGKTQWVTDHAFAGQLATASILNGDLLLSSQHGMALLNRVNGATRWRQPSGATGVKLTAVLGDHLYRVTRSPDKTSPDVVERLEPATGQVQWSCNLGGVLMSELVEAGQMLIGSIADALITIDMQTGRIRAREGLPQAFATAYPEKYQPAAQPDMIRISNERAFLARETGGVAAFHLPDGKLLWTQSVLGLAPGNYTAATPFKSVKLFQAFMENGIPARADQVRPANQTFNPVLNAAQQRYEGLERDRVESLRQNDPAKAEFFAGLQEAELGIQSFNSSISTSLNILQSATALSNAISTALYKRALEGLISRTSDEIEYAGRSYRSAFQGGYYTRPIADNDGIGVTVVDLANGKRHDLRYGPYSETIAAFGVDLPQFVISSDGRQLIVVGMGLNAQKFEPQVKWEHRMPKMSLLSYHVAGLRFVDTTPQLKQQADLMKMATHANDSKLYLAAFSGNVEEVRRLLDAGGNPNERVSLMDSTMTALMGAALMSRLEVAKLLLERGADPNLKESTGRTALDFAQKPEMKQLIQEAQKQKSK